jgi:hypothetical protein
VWKLCRRFLGNFSALTEGRRRLKLLAGSSKSALALLIRLDGEIQGAHIKNRP